MLYIITDTHFNHENIKKYCYRPDDFEIQIQQSLERLTKEDTLIHLGDICMGKDLECHEKYIIPLPCKKILVKGNHDKKTKTWYLNYGWNEVHDSYIVTMDDGKRILLSHEPIKNLENISYNFHGHWHAKTKIEPERLPFPYTKKHIRVSLEWNGYQIMEIEDIILANRVFETVEKI